MSAAPPRRPSIAGRLARQLLLISVFWALLAGLCVWLVVQEEVDELLDETLQASSQVLGQLLRQQAPMPAEVADGDDLSTHFAWQLVGPDGTLLHRSPLAPVKAWKLPPGFSDWADDGTDGDDWRVHVRPLPTAAGPGWLMVAQTSAERKEVRTRVGLASAFSALLVGGLCMVWLNRRARQELEPLDQLTVALAQYDPLDSRQLLPEQQRRELVEIRAAVLDLGQRLAQRVANERAFSAHAAHALRTPLAGMDAQLAMALREAPPEARGRLQRTREAADRLRRVVTALLTLFRTGMSLRWQRLDLIELLSMLPLPDGLALDMPEEAWVDADPDLLAAALINLLDNAWRHRATRLVLRCHALPGGGAVLEIADNGEGVPDWQRVDLNDALERQQYEGRMGLGLMMADLVARAHGGDLRLPAATEGFVVAMRLGPAPD
ncbi:sensor histidine kinase [Roseateles chitosanitabidus]|uniref:sensor histidine kinase n=1 Tax=Roseateles chitosanitabidus TaxID=65048 RepID=UPI00082A5648|nr:ATP-binding protein [Roseateles chitosanitabidus]MBO9689942.1 sensor histidine kinase [Roseateles chitosanitabidus]